MHTNALRGMMSKLRIGSKNWDDDRRDAPREVCDSVPAFGSLAGKFDANPRRKQRSIAARKSVVVASFKSARTDGIESDEEDSLEDSLEKIENEGTITMPPEKSLDKRSKLARDNSMARHRSQRLSALWADLSDVEEDEESDGTAEEADRRSHHLRNSPSEVPHILPDEIIVVLGGSMDDKKKVESRSCHQRNRRAKPRRRLQTSFRPKDDVGSSFNSVDSANFAGDFSAWQSFQPQLLSS